MTVAVGDRVICRRNDRFADVDNGTRGTVVTMCPHAVVIATDAGTERTLPAGYVAEHVEHAYCLTGHGMQGGTVEHATVVATPQALTRGWSYTALSRARGTTRLHIDGQELPPVPERAGLAPDQQRARPDASQVLARAAARMQVRDDEDLAVTQLPVQPAPGRADDPELGASARSATAAPEPAAERARPASAPAPGRDRLAALRDERAGLRAQRARLPLRELRQLDALEAEIAQVAAQRADVAERLAELPAPKRRLLGRDRDPHAAEARPARRGGRRGRPAAHRTRQPTRSADPRDRSGRGSPRRTRRARPAHRPA